MRELQRQNRWLLLTTCGFMAITGLGGGIGLVSGSITPGLEVLDGSPFSSYTIPGIVLVMVALSAWVAVVLIAVGHRVGHHAAAIAGVLMIGFELVEMSVIGSPAGAGRFLQLLFLALGTATVTAATPPRRRAIAIGLSLVVVAAAWNSGVRSWYLNWGASSVEQAFTLPGDDIIPRADWQQTRGITIAAPVERVWPWLAQIGQDRGGFYSFDLLENLVGCQMPVTDFLRPDHQEWKIGDRLWMYPPHRANGVGFATLNTLVPGRVLGFATHSDMTAGAVDDGSWAFVLLPIDASTTRLLIRERGPAGSTFFRRLFDRSIFEPMHFVMERRMMIGFKQIIEDADRHRVRNHVQVALWFVTILLATIGLLFALRRRHWIDGLDLVVISAIVFQVLTLAQPPLALGFALVLVVSAACWRLGHGPAFAH